MSNEKKRSTFDISNPDKLLYPVDKITKADLLHYYEMVTDWILPFIKNRPLTLLRCPEGYTNCFYQRHFNESTPKYLKSTGLKNKEKIENYIYLSNKKGLLSLVQMGVLEIHPWGSQIKNIERPDSITFDLDPGPDVTWKKIVAAALDIKKHLEQLNLISFVKTTGGKGLHIVVPIKAAYSWQEVKHFSHAFVALLARLKPHTYVSNMSKAHRSEKIFIDYLRNQRTASAIAAYSTRARRHAPIATPLLWEELSANKRDNQFTIATIPNRLCTLKNDPWETFWTLHQTLPLNN